MKIAIDVSQVVYGTGVSRYTQNLVTNLLEIDQENTYILFGGALRRISDLRSFLRSIKGTHVKKTAIPISPRMADFFWNRVHRLKVEKLIGNVDVLHTSDWAEPPSRAFKVTTVHDLTPVLFPKLTPARVVQTHKQRLAWVKKESKRIIAVSETTKKDLIELGFEKEKIIVIPEAVDTIYKPIGKEAVRIVKSRFKMQKNYLLAVGIHKRKNTERIIEAFLKVKKDLPLDLVLVGNPTFQIPKDDSIKVLGHVNEEYMPALYNGASALVYPSLYEGFGLPILEAMACKTPVVTSNIGSMAEVGKDAAILVDPESVGSIVKGIEKALTNRNEYIIKGMKRMKMYSWRRTAEETLKVYKEAIQN